jgi:regulator of sigma E protease
LSWLIVAVGIILLVILHEAGHFAAAKAVGMRVEKFSLFFGPMLVKFRRGETTYGIGPIPAGGYVKITGMNPREEIPPEVLPRAYFNQPVWKRIVVILAGPAVNLVIAFLLAWAVLAFHGPAEPTKAVASTEPGKPAAAVLHKGDRVVAVDGKPVRSSVDVAPLINRHKCAAVPPTPGCRATTPVRLTVIDHGVRRTFVLTPRYDASTRRMRLGFTFAERNVPMPVGEAAKNGVTVLWRATTQTVSRFVEVFFSSAARKDVHSIVGGYEVARQSFQFSFWDGVWVIALISLTLAVVNLFPFLPLDGGHVFWAVAEKVRGRRIPYSTMEKSGVIGFALILFIFLVGLSNDISTIAGNGFQVPR